ncbi:MAG: glycosyltransferase family 39 protein [Terriglobales bacterium]
MSQPNLRIRTEVLLLAVFSGFLFFYGLGSFGLVGADEPRYAQVSREMLNRSDWVLPTLDGKPWLEKPPLYYWQAMLSYRVAQALGSAKGRNETGTGAQRGAGSEYSFMGDGVSEWTARFPSALNAVLMISAIYFFLRRLRPGTELDGALITASCAGVIGFAHAAATDMPLAATFTIALLAWYEWYERRSRAALGIFYLFLALGTLAKGPIAPALAGVIVLLFAACRRDGNSILRTLWLPGILLFLVATLPWYVAVQMRDPDFFRVFILEHNFARFSSNLYHHPQPFWFYVPVFLLAAMPWTIWLIAAVVEGLRKTWRGRNEPNESFSAKNAWPLFLLVWMFVPILFFSASQSKLPGYILPAVPAAALLVTDYLVARREAAGKTGWPLALAHGLLCGGFVFAALSAGSIAMNHHLTRGPGTYVAAALGCVIAIGITVALLTEAGPRLVRSATMIAVIVAVAAVIRFGASAIDATQSARPVAQAIQAFSNESVPVALYHVSRIEEYGLEFYLNRPVQKYDSGEIPAQPHVLLATPGTSSDLRTLLEGRKVSYLTGMPEQKLNMYWVGK